MRKRSCIGLLLILATVEAAHGQQPVERPKTMTYAEAVSRVPHGRRIPDFWISHLDGLAAHLEAVRRGQVRVIATTPGGRPVHLVAYGQKEPVSHRANFNSAVGGRDATQYADKAAREKPVVLFVGPVHGQEVEGMVGLINLIHVMETGRDLLGRSQPTLRSLADRARVLIIPTGNPDGVARFEPGALQGMTRADLQFWGQGTWANDTLIGWPGAKRQHPMVGENVGYLGSYFNDAGVNPMHDEFFRPMSTEAPAILEVARQEAPDLAVSLHSHGSSSTLLRPAYVPTRVQEAVRDLHRVYNDALRERGLPTRSRLVAVSAEDGDPMAPFNLVSALHHVSGAVSFTHENAHGLIDLEQKTFTELLDTELALYEAMLRFALSERIQGG